MRKPAPLRCAGLHNLLPVIWRLYFNKPTKLNIQFLINCIKWGAIILYYIQLVYDGKQTCLILLEILY